MKTYLAIDIGGTRMRAAVYPQEGLTAVRQKRITTYTRTSAAIDRLIGLITELWPQDGTVAGIGVAAPGPVDPNKGMIYTTPNIPGWENFPLQRLLEDVFHVPVSLGNDANMATLGEWKYGAAVGHCNVLYMTISTGIGGGVICDNQLLLGEHGLATEIGHMTIDPTGPRCGCGHYGHLESFSSGTGIAHYVATQLAEGVSSSLPRDPLPTTVEIAAAAMAGDPLALAAFERAGRYLALGVANFLHIFNPSIIVFGGGVSRVGPLLFDPLRATLPEHVNSPAYLRDLLITTTALGDDSGLLGALYLVRG